MQFDAEIEAVDHLTGLIRTAAPELRDGEVLVVSEDWAKLWWVRLDGRAQLGAGEELRLARARLLERYPQYTDPAELDPVITITVTAWRAWRGVEPTR